MFVSREVSFKALHSHRGMLFEPVHEHEFHVVVGIKAPINEEGFVCDYRAVKRTFKKVIADRLSGTNLDDLFDYATSENLAVWVWQELTKFYPLHSIEVREKPHSRAVYYGPEH